MSDDEEKKYEIIKINKSNNRLNEYKKEKYPEQTFKKEKESVK